MSCFDQLRIAQGGKPDVGVLLVAPPASSALAGGAMSCSDPLRIAQGGKPDVGVLLDAPPAGGLRLQEAA